MELSPYGEYRNTNIAWSPSLPTEWDDTSVKFCFDIQLGKMLQPKPTSVDDIEFPYLKALHVNWDDINMEALPKMFASPEDIKKYEVEEGDLLICEGGEVGRAAILKDLHEPAIIQNALHRVRSDKLGDVHYFNYMLRCVADAGWFDILCNKATIAHLTGEKLGSIRLPVPPLQEQQKIATFLDYKTQQIDQLIAKKKALIEKLEEQRIAVITQAVTKGLDKDVKLMPSGVDWLGDVPEGWDCVYLRYVTEKITSGSRGWARYFSDDGDIFLRITNLNRNSIELLSTDIKRVNLPEGSEGERTKTVVGDLLISITADLGSVAVIPSVFGGSYVSQHVALVRPEQDKIIPKWIAYCIFSHIGKIQLLGAGYGGTKVQLGLNDIKEVLIPKPKSLEEQRLIIDYIDSNTKDTQHSINLVQQVITRLHEYRSALITAAVTGKIDVRDWQAPTEIKQVAEIC